MQTNGFLALARPSGHITKRFCRSTNGNIAIIFALTLIPLLSAIGGSIDLSRAMLAKQRLAGALDATALAVSVEARSNDHWLSVLAQNFFNANYSENQIGTPGPIEVTAVDGVVRVSGTARIDTTLLKLLDIDHIDVTAVSESSQNLGSLRVSR